MLLIGRFQGRACVFVKMFQGRGGMFGRTDRPAGRFPAY